MAKYTPSNLVTAQAKLTQKFAASELRFRNPATFLSIAKMSEIMFPDSKVLRTREDRALEAYYKKRTARSLGATRAHNHTGTKGDSDKLTPSWLTYGDKFYLSLKQADNNIFTLDEMLMNEIENSVANFAEGLETAAVDFIYAGRTQVNGAAVEGSFNGVKFAYEITEATNGTRAIQITTTVMDVLKYGQNVTIYCDSISFNKFRFQAAQGATNATNLSFQFLNTTFIHSPELSAKASADAYTKGYWVVVPDGTAGVLDWIPKQNREGKVTSVNTYGTLINPVDGLTYALHTYEERADESANNGQKQDVITQFELSIDLALEQAPLSVANESTFIAFALV